MSKDAESGLNVDLGNLSGAEDIGELKNVIMAQEAEIKLSGMWSTIVAILKTMVGAGILGLPYAFMAGGWVFAVLVFPIIALVTGYCMVALIRSKDAAHLSRTASPSDVGESAFGAAGRIIVAIVLCADSFGVCLSYFIFITYNMYLMTNVRQEAWAVVFFFFFLIISYIRPVKFISYLTLVACFLTLIGLIITLVAVYAFADTVGEIHSFNWKDFPLFIGIVLFAFQAINIAMPAYNTLRNPKRFTPAVIIVLSIGLVAYLIFGLLVYFRIAENAEGGMLTEIITNKPVQVVVCILFILSLCANMVCWIYAIYEVSDRLSCANKVYIMSAADRARILAENEGAAITPENSTPTPNPSPSATPNTVTGDESILDTSTKSNTASVSSIQPLQEEEGVIAQPEPGYLKRILINWRYWLLSTIGRIVVLLIIMIPSVTPARDHFNSFMGLSGCLTGVLMSFIMPMCAQLKLQWKTMPIWQKILDIVILVISVPGMIYVTVITLIDLVKSLQNPE